MAKKLAGIYFDERRTERVRSARTPKESVRKVLEEIQKKKKVSKRKGYKKRQVDY
jgi:hypothetical protein